MSETTVVVAANVTVSAGPLPKVTLPSNVASVVNVVPPTVVTSPSRRTGPGNVVVVVPAASPIRSAVPVDGSTATPTKRVSAFAIC